MQLGERRTPPTHPRPSPGHAGRCVRPYNRHNRLRDTLTGVALHPCRFVFNSFLPRAAFSGKDADAPGEAGPEVPDRGDHHTLPGAAGYRLCSRRWRCQEEAP